MLQDHHEVAPKGEDHQEAGEGEDHHIPQDPIHHRHDLLIGKGRMKLTAMPEVVAGEWGEDGAEETGAGEWGEDGAEETGAGEWGGDGAEETGLEREQRGRGGSPLSHITFTGNEEGEDGAGEEEEGAGEEEDGAREEEEGAGEDGRDS